MRYSLVYPALPLLDVEAGECCWGGAVPTVVVK